MKRLNYFLMLVAVFSVATGCNKVTFKKTKSGMAYKIFPGKSKDSLIRTGVVVKYHVKYELNDDSLLFTSYGKAPQYVIVQEQTPPYNMLELFPMMKKGDSAVAVLLVDSLLKQGAQLPFAKKGDRIMTTFRIIDVFTSDSLGRADYDVEMEKDRPRREKEQQEEMAKRIKEQEEMAIKEEQELEKSGEIARELQDMEGYLAKKNIKAEKTGKGTYVKIDQQGTGAQVEKSKYVNVKYTGRLLETDSVFQTNSYAFQIGKRAAIAGWDEGLLLFKEGGKGTLYVPGFLAYGKNPPPGSPFKPFEALKFDIEVLKVSDTPLTNERPAQ